MLDLSVPLAVVCHDAGAANLIFAWLRAYAEEHPQSSKDWRLVLQGPALHLWDESYAPQARLCSTVDLALDEAVMLLSGTGWASDLEYDARVAAQTRGARSLAVIDHWVNYSARFERNGVLLLPDEILVADEYAVAEAKCCFPDTPVAQLPNLYLQDAVSAIAPLDDQSGDILYVLEPIRSMWGRNQPGEFQALDYFAENLNCLGPGAQCPIRLRPHPSDFPGKYDQWMASHAELNVTIDSSSTLSQAISCAKWVAGAETFAMVVALGAGRQVISTLPPWAHRCRLPHHQIVHLRDILPAAEGSQR